MSRSSQFNAFNLPGHGWWTMSERETRNYGTMKVSIKIPLESLWRVLSRLINSVPLRIIRVTSGDPFFRVKVWNATGNISENEDRTFPTRSIGIITCKISIISISFEESFVLNRPQKGPLIRTSRASYESRGFAKTARSRAGLISLDDGPCGKLC